MAKTPLQCIDLLLKQAELKLSNGDKLALINTVCEKKLSLVDLFVRRHHLSSAQEAALALAVGKLKNGYPLQYLLKSVMFCALSFYVDERVLIPRPETEELVYEIYELIKRDYKDRKLVIADIGCGSLAIGISLSFMLQRYLMVNAEVHAVDISEEALEVAKKNATLHVKEVNLYKGDLLSPLIEKHIKPNIIIANLPYINDDYPLDKNVTYEPAIALRGGKDGLDIIRRFFKMLPSIMTDDTIVCLEIGFDQAEKALALANQAWKSPNWRASKDLFGQYRQLIYAPLESKKKNKI